MIESRQCDFCSLTGADWSCVSMGCDCCGGGGGGGSACSAGAGVAVSSTSLLPPLPVGVTGEHARCTSSGH